MTPTTPGKEKYTQFSCPNPACSVFNHPGQGNLSHRSWTGKDKHIERLVCVVFGRGFSDRKGTLMEESKLPGETVERLLKCQRWGSVTQARLRYAESISKVCIGFRRWPQSVPRRITIRWDTTSSPVARNSVMMTSTAT